MNSISKTTIRTYPQWRLAAERADNNSGATRWRADPRSPLYDYRVIAHRLEELRAVRAGGDMTKLLYYMGEGFHGNMAGMGNPALYERSKLGTKYIIEDYTAEMVGALETIEAVDGAVISVSEKIQFFRRSASCFGRSALMLSGAGSLGPFHLGVVKAMVEQDLLPNVISGASAGSIVAAIAGTRSQADLTQLLASDIAATQFNAMQQTEGDQVASDDLAEMLAKLIPDMTFEEAHAESGRYINVSVAPLAVNQRSRLLNAITSPNACIREAVLASCAIPGVFPAVKLKAKNSQGQRTDYVGSRRWVDGSITDDLPAKRLARLYGVNHFISSQTNPLVLWALHDPNSQNVVSQIANVYTSALREWSKIAYPFVMNALRDVYPLNIMTRMWFGLATQNYMADINILPASRLIDPTRLLGKLSEKETAALVLQGEQSTWPKIQMIKTCTAVSSFIDQALQRLETRALS